MTGLWVQRQHRLMHRELWGGCSRRSHTDRGGRGQGPADGCIEVFSEREVKQGSKGVTPHSWDQARGSASQQNMRAGTLMPAHLGTHGRSTGN